VSRAALNLFPASSESVPWYLKNAPRVTDEPAASPSSDDTTSLEDVLWRALRNVGEDGADVGELMRVTGMGRSTVYRYLAQLAQDGRTSQVEWGRWRSQPGRW
jgi:hypothetical protein